MFLATMSAQRMHRQVTCNASILHDRPLSSPFLVNRWSSVVPGLIGPCGVTSSTDTLTVADWVHGDSSGCRPCICACTTVLVTAHPNPQAFAAYNFGEPTMNTPPPRTQVLDCTLRDGGYYTEWDFEPDMVERYLDAMSRLPVDIIEIGYCNHPATGYFGRFFYLTRDDLAPIKARLAPGQKLAIMLNAKDTDARRVGLLLGELGGVVDVVRLAVPPKQIGEALDLAEAIVGLGFEVGFNLMYLSSYADQIEQLAPLCARRHLLTTLALVDSYGSCMPAQVARAVRATRELLPDVALGFHGHDNLGLAYANTLAAIEAGAVIVDATLGGMGRGAGNTRTELFLVHQAERSGTPLDHEALSATMADLDGLRAVHQWGTNLPYMISGAANLPQRDVMDWLGKNRYSVVSILRALRHEAGAASDSRDFPALAAADAGAGSTQELLIVGGGASVQAHGAALSRLVQRQGWAVVHANVRNLADVDRFGQRQLICLAGLAVPRLPSAEQLAAVGAFVVPEPPRMDGAVPDLGGHAVRQVRPFTGEQQPQQLGPISDIGPLALALGAALTVGAKRIHLAGFDGYPHASTAQQGLASEIQALLDNFRRSHPDIGLVSLTPTLYAVPMESVYARLSGG